VRSAREAAWPGHLDADAADLAAAEREVMVRTIRRVLGETVAVAARVMVGSDATAPVHGGSGAEIAQLRPFAPVAVVGPAERGARERLVRLADGRSGWVSGRQLLVERAVTRTGRVVRSGDELGIVVGGEAVPLVGKDGPNAPDAELETLAALAGRTVELHAIERMIGQRYWLAPRSFERVAAGAPGGAYEGLSGAIDPR